MNTMTKTSTAEPTTTTPQLGLHGEGIYTAALKAEGVKRAAFDYMTLPPAMRSCLEVPSENVWLKDAEASLGELLQRREACDKRITQAEQTCAAANYINRRAKLPKARVEWRAAVAERDTITDAIRVAQAEIKAAKVAWPDLERMAWLRASVMRMMAVQTTIRRDLDTEEQRAGRIASVTKRAAGGDDRACAEAGEAARRESAKAISSTPAHRMALRIAAETFQQWRVAAGKGRIAPEHDVLHVIGHAGVQGVIQELHDELREGERPSC
jgi:hypothetical protein